MQKNLFLYSYLFAIFLNFFLILLLFSSLHFNLFLKKKEEKVYVRLIAKPAFEKKTKPNLLPKSIQEPNIEMQIPPKKIHLLPHKNLKSETIQKEKSKQEINQMVSQTKTKNQTEKQIKPKLKNEEKPMLVKKELKKEPKAQAKAEPEVEPKAQPKPKDVPKPKEIKETTPKKHTPENKQQPVLTPEEEELLKQRLKALKEKEEKEKKLQELRKQIMTSYALMKAEEKAEEIKKIEEEYRQNAIELIKQILEENFSLPIYLKNKEFSAVVLLEIKNGIITYKFLQKSKNEDFNRAVEECLKQSSPLPIEGELKLTVKFRSIKIEAY